MVALTPELLVSASGDSYDVGLLVDRLRLRLDSFVAEARSAIMAQVPAYGQNDQADLREEVASNCAQVFGIFLDTLAAGRPPVPGDFPMAAGYAARRSGAGIALEDFLKAFRVGQAALWEQVRATAVDLPGGSEAAAAVVGHLMATIEAGSSAAARAYVDSTNLRATDVARVERDLMEDLLSGRADTAATRTEVLAGAGLAADSRVLVGIGLPRDPEGTAPFLPEAADLVSRAVAQSVGGVVVVRQDEVVAVVPVDELGEATVMARLTRLVESLSSRGVPVTFGFSTIHAGLAEVPAAHREAELARSTLGDRPGLLALSSMSTLDYLVTCADDSARRLIRPAVRAFIEEDACDGGVLVDTLLKYVAADMNARSAAVQLHVHVNTIYYRLDRITERTGHDLRRLDEAFELLLAVRLLAA